MANKVNPVFHVVVSTAGRFDMLEMCLDAIYADATYPISIAVVDDATKKEEKLHHKHLFEYQKEKDVHNNVVSFTSLRNEAQMGFGASYNRGARQAKTPYLTILNDDVMIDRGYFDGVMKVMQDKTIGIVGARLLFPATSTSKNRPAGKIQHVGVALDIRGNAVHPMIGWSADNPKTKVSREALAVTGALLTIRGDIFRALGGFDPIYGLGYWEDIDLCLKARQKGGRIWFESSIGGTHNANSTSEKNPNAFGNQFQQNAMTFRARWSSTGLLVFDSWSY
jgi:GT2 family glycosyltransferase